MNVDKFVIFNNIALHVR